MSAGCDPEGMDALYDLLAQPPTAYLILFAIAAGDAVFPALPSESAAILAGVLAAIEPGIALPACSVQPQWARSLETRRPRTGSDFGGRRAQRRFFDGPYTRRGVRWACIQLRRRGATILVVARAVPRGPNRRHLHERLDRLPLRALRALHRDRGLPLVALRRPARLLRRARLPRAPRCSHSPWRLLSRRDCIPRRTCAAPGRSCPSSSSQGRRCGTLFTCDRRSARLRRLAPSTRATRSSSRTRGTPAPRVCSRLSASRRSPARAQASPSRSAGSTERRSTRSPSTPGP